jgi:hypothetical protein
MVSTMNVFPKCISRLCESFVLMKHDFTVGVGLVKRTTSEKLLWGHPHTFLAVTQNWKLSWSHLWSFAGEKSTFVFTYGSFSLRQPEALQRARIIIFCFFFRREEIFLRRKSFERIKKKNPLFFWRDWNCSLNFRSDFEFADAFFPAGVDLPVPQRVSFLPFVQLYQLYQLYQLCSRIVPH